MYLGKNMGFFNISTMKTIPVITTIALLVGCSSIDAPVPQSDAGQRDFLHFLEANGCVIGPSTQDAAMAAGLDPASIERFSRDLVSQYSTAREDGWTILPAEVCKIRPPAISSMVKPQDAAVRQHLSDINVPDAWGEVGCFLAPTVRAHLATEHNWDTETAVLEYERFRAAGVIEGWLSFYSNDPLITPRGFQVIEGECAAIPDLAERQKNHRLLLEHFDALIRENAKITRCEPDSVGIRHFYDIARDLSDGEITNVWIGIEVLVIMQAAGWFEGRSSTAPGTPRPPVCL